MINGDDGASLAYALGIHVNSRFRERRVNVVYWDRVMRVGSAIPPSNTIQVGARRVNSLARHIDYNGQSTRVTSLSDKVGRDKFGNWLR